MSKKREPRIAQPQIDRIAMANKIALEMREVHEVRVWLHNLATVSLTEPAQRLAAMRLRDLLEGVELRTEKVVSELRAIALIQ